MRLTLIGLMAAFTVAAALPSTMPSIEASESKQNPIPCTITGAKGGGSLKPGYTECYGKTFPNEDGKGTRPIENCLAEIKSGKGYCHSRDYCCNNQSDELKCHTEFGDRESCN